MAYNGVITISLEEYLALPLRDRLQLHRALSDHLEGLAPGVLSGLPRAERR